MHNHWDEVLLARLEIIFICIGIVAILLGSVISIWTKLDSEFQNLHKPAKNENDCEMLPRTDAAGSVDITSNRHEGSIAGNE